MKGMYIARASLSLSMTVLLVTAFNAADISDPIGGSAPVNVDQGSDWTESMRRGFYTQDQGSQIIPLAWMRALKVSGKPFLDALPDYGYLPNASSVPPGLPVGFTTNDGQIGMTCSACHTREIEVDQHAYRIDGGPAIVDFQAFLVDLRNAVKDVLTTDPAFDVFAAAVLGSPPSTEQRTDLFTKVSVWYRRYDTIVSRSLAIERPWGPGRLDAVGMIFNRLTGLDIGTTPDRIIADNIHPAAAPVRYPFLWNAAIQDRTQWPGFADNGDDLLALSRNLELR